MPYRCRHCGGTHCGEHRLPENHDCPGLQNWGDPSGTGSGGGGGVFDSGFDDSVDQRGGSGGFLSGLTKTGGPLGYFSGNVAYLFLAIILVVFALEWVVLLFAGQDAFRALFVLTSANPLYVWTWVTSVFSHDPFNFTHIFGNGIVLFFFGPFLERRIGSKRFAILFLVSGMVAGLGQIAFGFLIGNTVSGVLGASGAIMAIMGVITVLNPDLRVYLYFLLPVPIWVLTFGYAGLSLLGVVAQGNVLGNVAHAAHLLGLVIGLAYGQYAKERGVGAPSQLQFGQGGGPGGPGGPGGRF